MGRNAKRAKYEPPPNIPAPEAVQDQDDRGQPEVCTEPAGLKKNAVRLMRHLGYITTRIFAGNSRG